jgi:nucleoside-diphosphate-sugar epimerase
MSEILVTGATGFIGRHLITRLLHEGRSIRIITRKPDNLPPEWRERLQIVTGDLLDPEVRKAATHGISSVFHLAAEINNPAIMEAINIGAVRLVLEAAVAARVKSFVHLSSIGVVGAFQAGVITEETPCQPQNEYERTKLEGERTVSEFAKSGRIKAVILRPTIVFGEDQVRPRDSVLSWLRAIQQGRFFFIGEGSMANYVYVGDVVETMVRLAESLHPESIILNVANPAPMSDFVRAMADALGVAPPTRSIPVWLAYAAGTAFETTNRLIGTPAPLTRPRVRALSSKCVYSDDKLRQQMGLMLPFGYERGLARTVRWYKRVGKL